MSDCSCEKQDGYANCCRAKSLTNRVSEHEMREDLLKKENARLHYALESIRSDLQYLWAGHKRHGEWPPCLPGYVERALNVAVLHLIKLR